MAVIRKRLSPLTAAVCAATFLTAGGLPGTAIAHDGPEHVIEALTARMAREGTSASLLYRRAVEYRALGRLDRAAEDLAAAVRNAPSYVPAQRELCLVRLAQGRNDDALAAINQALSLTVSERDRAPLYMVRTQVHAEGGRDAAALSDCERAFRRGGSEVDWYLTRVRLQARLGRWDAALTGLRQGIQQTGGSAVLKVELVETLIDAGRYNEALARIEPELKTVRWQSAWRIRRGRALLGQNKTAQAQAELEAAIAEMEPRIRPRTPDLMLVADRGLAYALLGDRTRARRDLEAVRSGGGGNWLTHRLKAALGAG
jgi:tetratricopeptide (TPR) repeat protein